MRHFYYSLFSLFYFLAVLSNQFFTTVFVAHHRCTLLVWYAFSSVRWKETSRASDLPTQAPYPSPTHTDPRGMKKALLWCTLILFLSSVSPWRATIPVVCLRKNKTKQKLFFFPSICLFVLFCMFLKKSQRWGSVVDQPPGKTHLFPCVPVDVLASVCQQIWHKVWTFLAQMEGLWR